MFLQVGFSSSTCVPDVNVKAHDVMICYISLLLDYIKVYFIGFGLFERIFQAVGS